MSASPITVSPTQQALERLGAVASSLQVPEAAAATEPPAQPAVPAETPTMPDLAPVPNSTTPFWRTSPHRLDNCRSSDTLPAECDVLIIGSGYSGVAIAHHMVRDGDAENQSPLDIVMLEARSACSGATGRNGGQLKSDPYYKATEHIKRFGRAVAESLAAFEVAQVYAVKKLVETEQMADVCDFVLTRAYDVILDAGLAAAKKHEYDQLKASGFATVQDDLWYLPGPAAQVLTGVKAAQCAFSYTVGSVWPYKMVMHLLAKLVDAGRVKLHTHTPVTSVGDAPDPARGGRWAVETPRGTVWAKKVVFATNGYTAGLMPQYRNRIIPARGICSRITTPAKSNAPCLPYSYSVRFHAKGANYQISRPDGSLILGGARPTYLTQEETWYNMVDDSTLIAPAASHFDDFMQRTYRGWEDSGAKPSHIWTGIMGYTSDLMPHVGEVPSKPGQFVSAGFNGGGMPKILLTSKGVAKMVRTGCSFEETGIPSPYKTSAERLADEFNRIQTLLKPVGE